MKHEDLIRRGSMVKLVGTKHGHGFRVGDIVTVVKELFSYVDGPIFKVEGSCGETWYGAADEVRKVA